MSDRPELTPAEVGEMLAKFAKGELTPEEAALYGYTMSSHVLGPPTPVDPFGNINWLGAGEPQGAIFFDTITKPGKRR